MWEDSASFSPSFMELFNHHIHLNRFAPTCSLLMLMLVLFWSGNTKGVSVTGGDLTVVEGHDVTLPCKMTEQEKTLTQISWRRKTRGMPGNPFFYTISEENGQSFVNDPDPRISFIGNFAERDGTLQISNVSLNDEGSYTCIFSLFPSGTYSTEIPLRVEVPPATSLNSTLLVLGNEEVLLATCTAAASRPAAQLRWIIGALGKNLRETTSVTEHDNGTTTTVSSLFGVPRREISGHEVQCVVSSSALAEEHREAFTLQVFFPPMNVTIVETSDDTLECVSEGNPEPSVRWTRQQHSFGARPKFTTTATRHPSDLFPPDTPDWLPLVDLGHNKVPAPPPAAQARDEHARSRNKRRKDSEAAQSLVALQTMS
ncbi:nectin-4-like isoform X6 [Salarias fasciatus]|uniref:nectin-4-like isoform X6 n=1 Tax=Salarias fasciatus TaxID=181472 RepID=UPI0011768A39|nr:nectin-4-like isoform X6 [Salarias fasciatus]